MIPTGRNHAPGMRWLLLGALCCSAEATAGPSMAAEIFTPLVASIASLVSVTAASMALAIGLRVRAYRRLCILALALAGLFASCGGMLGAAASSHGVSGWVLLTAGAALMFSSTMLAADSGPHAWSPWLDRLGWALAALGVVSWLLPFVGQASALGAVGAVGAIGLSLCVPLALRFALNGSRMAWFMSLLAVMLALSAWVPLAEAHGWWNNGAGLRAAFAPLGAIAVLGLFIALSDRLVTLRVAHEATLEQHAQSSAHLAVVRHRQQFAGDLKELGKTSQLETDLEWQAWRLLAQSVQGRIGAEFAAVVAKGYRDFDYELTEPMGSKEAFAALLAGRSVTLQGICRSRRPVQLPLTLEEKADAATAPQYAVVPLGVPRPGWGALILRRRSGVQFSQSELEEMADLVDLTMDTIEEAAERVALKREADLDALTGVISKRAGMTRLDSLVREAAKQKEPLTVLFVDLDHFKPLNEKQGIPVGDACLRAIADVIRDQLDEQGAVFREGGDEFAVLLPNHSAEQARKVAENIRAEVAALRVPAGNGTVKITVSIGVAEAAPADTVGQRVLDRAERASDGAKGSGRNRVHVLAQEQERAGPGDALIL